MSENSSKLLQSFINDIIDVFPEYENRLLKYYQPKLEEGIVNDKLTEFLENIDLISEKIVNKDIKLFDEDPIILQNVSFKLLWNTKDISDQTKNSIWKYLQTFCAMNIQNNSEKEKIDEVIKSIESHEKVKDKALAFEAAKCLGSFYHSLPDFNAEQLHITLPNFHNADFRFKELQAAIKTADLNRLNQAKDMIAAIIKEQYVLNKFDKLNIELPKRAVHFDAKISNFLFDKHTNKAKAIILSKLYTR